MTIYIIVGVLAAGILYFAVRGLYMRGRYAERASEAAHWDQQSQQRADLVSTLGAIGGSIRGVFTGGR